MRLPRGIWMLRARVRSTWIGIVYWVQLRLGLVKTFDKMTKNDKMELLIKLQAALDEFKRNKERWLGSSRGGMMCAEKMKILYISGAISSSTVNGMHRNIAKARECAIKYWREGYATICPATNTAFMDGIFGEDYEENWAGFLAGDLRIIEVVDVVVMMPKWKDSRGAVAEHDKAMKLNKEIIYEVDPEALKVSLGALVDEVTDDNLHDEMPNPEDLCGTTDCMIGAPSDVECASEYAPPPCWCGKELETHGIGDFHDDERPSTISLACPVHGQDYERPMGIGISGKARSGKDRFCKELLKVLGDGWHREALADRVKLEWAGENHPTVYAEKGSIETLEWANNQKNDPGVREQWIKKGMARREVDPGYWLKKLPCLPNAIVTDCRFLNEVDFLKERGFFMVRIEATEATRLARGCGNLDDASECELDDSGTKWDLVVYNDGDIAALENSARIVAKTIQGEEDGR